MTNFESLKEMSVNQLAYWLDKNGLQSDALWDNWFVKKYCDNCESIIKKLDYMDREYECTFCEINGYCKFFPEKQDTLSGEEVIKLWLESEV